MLCWENMENAEPLVLSQGLDQVAIGLQLLGFLPELREIAGWWRGTLRAIFLHPGCRGWYTYF